MNSAGGRCHDNAKCESMWARLKSELLYDRVNTEDLTVEELKVMIWRYFISYWNNRRICTANGGLPPMIKRQRYYDSLQLAAQSMNPLSKMCQPILTTSVDGITAMTMFMGVSLMVIKVAAAWIKRSIMGILLYA